MIFNCKRGHNLYHKHNLASATVKKFASEDYWDKKYSTACPFTRQATSIPYSSLLFTI